jgi:multidrug efflux system membrane fusion protein
MPTVHSTETNHREDQTSPDAFVDLSPDGGDSSRTGKLRIVIVLILIAAVVGFAVWKIHANLTDTAAAPSGKRSSSSGGGDRPVPVTSAPVEQKSMPIYLDGLGTVTGYYSVTIKTRVDGQLTSVNVKEGQKVHKGQLLAQIDSAPYAAAVAQAEGQLARDKATATYANVAAERYTNLYNAGVVSQDSEQTQLAAAGQIAGALQADKAAIQAAKVNLDYTRITSPIEGVVGLRQVDPGNIVHAADTTGLILVTQLQPITVIFTLPEDQLPQVQEPMLKGAKLVVEAYDRSQSKLLATGKLLTLDNQIDTTTGTVKVKAVFDNKDNSLFPNQFVNVRLILEQRPDALVIPASAVQTGAQGTFVYVVKKGDPPAKGSDDSGGGGGGGHHHRDAAAAADTTAAPADKKSATAPEAAPATGKSADSASSKPDDAEKKYYVAVRPITIDMTEGAQVIVGSGLSAGDQVVIDGLEKLKNGSKVSPKKEGGSKSGKASQGDAAKGATAADSKPGDDASGGHKHHGGDASAASPAVAADAPHEHHHHDHGQQP